MSKMNLNVGIRGLGRGASILDITVPDALRRRVASGVGFFDDALGGEGFVPSSVMMLTGTPGAGKTTLLLQLADSITAAGHICLYNTGEESLYQVKMVTERLGLRNGFVVGQDISVTSLLAHADMLRATYPGRQVFILQDSLQTLEDEVAEARGGANSMTPVRVTEALTDWAKANYGVVIFIGQVTKDGDFAGKQTILHAVDVRGRLYIDQEKRSETYGERIFEVTKNRFGVSGRGYILDLGRSGLREKGSFQYSTGV